MSVDTLHGTAFDRILDALRAHGSKVVPQAGGQGAKAQCPAHDDQHPSLSVTQTETRSKVKCFAGCADTAVLDALGLTVVDLYNEPRTRYRYTDATGTKTVRTVTRIMSPSGKDFRQHVADTSVTPLYRLPDVISAVESTKMIFLVEGEEDVHALESLGCVATTAPQGSSSFSKVDTTPLHGASVVVVVDRDDAGARWAADVRAALDGLANLEFRQAAIGKDSSDHLAAGLGLDELEPYEVPDEAARAPSVVTLSDVEPERVSWLWPGRLPAGKLVVVDGDPSTGKSTLGLDLAAHVSTGTSWPDGAPCPPGDVLLMSAEDGLADTIAPRLVAAGADRRRVHALTAVPVVDEDGDDNVRMVPPSLPRDIGVVRDIVNRYRVRLLVVDVLMAYLSGRVDSHRDQDMRSILAQLATLAEEAGCTIILIRHLNKGGGGNALYRGGGSIGIVGAARAAFLVGRDPEDADRRIFAITKSNLAAEAPTLAYRLVNDPTNGCARVEWEADPVDGMTTAELLRGPVDDDEKSERDQCAEWLSGYLMDNGGEARPEDVFKAGRVLGWSVDQLKRSKKKAGVRSATAGVGKGWVWTLAPKGAPKGAREQGPESRSLAPLGAPLQESDDERRAS